MLVVMVMPCDVVIGALVAEMVELTGYHPCFALADEPVANAVRRIQPAVILADADCRQAEGPELEAAAALGGAELVFFGGRLDERELRDFAAAHNAVAFPLPNGTRAMERVLRDAVARRVVPDEDEDEDEAAAGGRASGGRSTSPDRHAAAGD